jgi:hypothetical protein
MQALTSAENVFTDPNFLGQAFGVRDDGVDDLNNEISRLITQIKEDNAVIRTDLNENVLKHWGIPFLPISPPKDKEIFDRVIQLMEELERYPEKINENATEAFRFGSFLQSNISELQLSEKQRQSFADFNDFVQRVMESLGNPSVEEVSEALPQARDAYLDALQKLISNCSDAKPRAAELLELSGKLPGTERAEEVREARDLAEEISDAAAKWREIPTYDDSVFDPVGGDSASASGEAQQESDASSSGSADNTSSTESGETSSEPADASSESDSQPSSDVGSEIDVVERQGAMRAESSARAIELADKAVKEARIAVRRAEEALELAKQAAGTGIFGDPQGP